ncbi:MAG TPA: erythromycin esterase family protein [Coxiellaceae bacterium]|nr:erythromycin esterase family protein [Coxiellaceae bacterium]
MHESIKNKLIQLLNKEILPFSMDEPNTFDSLIKLVGDSRIVLMGEASHGTEEFYNARIELTKRLILENEFNAIAIEADWTSAIPICHYLKGISEDSAEDSLSEFKRFPEWMWRNTTIPPFLQWLRNHNDGYSSDQAKIGLYGLDLYCLNNSMQAVIDYLKHYDEAAANIAMQRYACFDHHVADPQQYVYLVENKLKTPCVKEVSNQFLDMQHLAFTRLTKNLSDKTDALFYALQNARLVKNAEHYYRALFESNQLSWNIRDQHMAETVQNLIAYLEDKLNKPAKIIVWAHNSHVGDARATEMSAKGELNLGQIVREQFNLSSCLIGFSTYSGKVTAADNWGSEGQCKTIQPALRGSYEFLLHNLHMKNFSLNLRKDVRVNELLLAPQLQRTIGVIYRPDSERMSHYYFSRLPYQFDALVHFDRSTAIKPINLTNDYHSDEALDTYPSGI